jgi:DeoR/GlpR family transcriptional regulator of sugar metabolism
MSLSDSAAATGGEVPDYALPARRRGELLRLARTRGSITVADIANQFAVSADTIRRDLVYLAERGLLTRTHGGAVPAEDVMARDVPVTQRVANRAAEKARIAREAASLVVDGETLMIYGGSTTRAFVGALGSRRNLTIVTNDLGIPAVVSPNSSRAVYVLGGQVLEQAQITIGLVGFPKAGPLTADTAVLSVGGITEHGLSTTVLEEAVMMSGMMDAARRVIVLADTVKLGRSVFAHVSPLEWIDVLVTDGPPAPDFAAALNEAGVELIVAR